MIYENIVQTIGKTPIVRINSVHEEGMAEIYAKLEFFNPGGSVKDRIAANMILGMQKEGALKKGDVIALSGASGRVSGPHLHFGVIVGGVQVNPLNFVKKINEILN